MEQLNKVELIGTVESVYIKEFGNTRCVNFSVATNHCFKDMSGCPVIETTWHRVLAWEDPDAADAFKLEKGSPVHVIGRIRVQRYTGADGVERQTVEIVASKIENVYYSLPEFQLLFIFVSVRQLSFDSPGGHI